MIPLGVLAQRQAAAGGVVLFSDDFNRADGALGANWVTVSGVPTIASNQAAHSANNTTARCVVDASTADHYAQIRAITSPPGDDQAALVRMATSGETYYMGRYSTATASWEIHKRISGTFTLLGSFADTQPTPSYVVRLEVEGNALRLYGDGDLKVSLTDSSITGNTRTGFRLNVTGDRLDDFEMGTL